MFQQLGQRIDDAFGWLRATLGSTNVPVQTARKYFFRDDGQITDRQRGFDSAKSTDDNRHRWCGADNRSINQLLHQQLRIMHERCAYEARNNSLVEGTIASHARDCVGRNGPRIQVETNSDTAHSDRWVERAEEVIRDWCEECTADGQSSLGDWLRSDMADLWKIGDQLAQIVTDRDSTNDIFTKIHELDGRGLWHNHSNPKVLFGIERNQFRRPTYYNIVDVEEEFGLFNSHYGLAINPKRIPAKDILHSFIKKEKGQIRGYPLMAASLDAVNELREYDGAVLGAAKAAAYLHAVMSATSDGVIPDADASAFELAGSGTVTKTPIGWQLNTLDSKQPGPQNTEFRSERSRELGLPAGMPLMKIRHDASNHNYSSARFDAGDYNRACGVFQQWLWRKRIKVPVVLVLQEAMLRGRLAPRALNKIRLRAEWDQPPHADPVKEALAAKLRMEMRISSPQLECIPLGHDFEKICSDWKRANELLEKNNMPPMLGAVPTNLEELVAYLNPAMGDEVASDEPQLSVAS